MRYGVAAWNYFEPDKPLETLIGNLAAIGCDCISLQLHHVGELPEESWRALCHVVAQADLAVVLHSNFPLFRAEHLCLARERLGDRVLDVTLDAAMETTSCGTRYDMAQMRPVLEAIAAHAPGLPFGVEDFPLDDAALAEYAADLQPLLNIPGFGALIDLGHMNMRLRMHPYFQQTDAAGYIRNVPVPIHEVHIHDNDGTRDQHCHPGQGNCDLAGAARGLRDVGFDGICTVEVAPTFHGATPADSWPALPRSLQAWQQLMQS